MPVLSKKQYAEKVKRERKAPSRPHLENKINDTVQDTQPKKYRFMNDEFYGTHETHDYLLNVNNSVVKLKMNNGVIVCEGEEQRKELTKKGFVFMGEIL